MNTLLRRDGTTLAALLAPLLTALPMAFILALLLVHPVVGNAQQKDSTVQDSTVQGDAMQDGTVQDGTVQDAMTHAIPSHLATKNLLLDATRAGQRLVAVGEYGHIVYSDDQGLTWTQAALVPTQATLTSVHFVDASTGYALGHDAVVLKTEDKGETWSLQYSDLKAESPLFGVAFKDARRGYAVGAFSYMLETTDGGKTWQQRALSPKSMDDFHLNGIFSDKRGNFYIPAEFGVIYKSTDGGKTFKPIQTPYEGSFWGGLEMQDGAIMVYGMSGNAYVSKDAGATWRKLATNTDKSFHDAEIFSDGTIVMTGLNGIVAVSHDGGKTFKSASRADRKGHAALIEGADGEIFLFGETGITAHGKVN